MEELFYDGLGNSYVKPNGEKVGDRFATYALVYVKDIKKYLFINPVPKLTNTFYKFVGGGIEDGEKTLEALKREFVEEIGFPILDIYEQVDYIEYTVPFKMIKRNEYWYNHQSIYFFTVDNFKDTLYPNESKWISPLEELPVHLLSREEILNNLENFHFTIKKAIKRFIV